MKNCCSDIPISERESKCATFSPPSRYLVRLAHNVRVDLPIRLVSDDIGMHVFGRPDLEILSHVDIKLGKEVLTIVAKGFDYHTNEPFNPIAHENMK